MIHNEDGSITLTPTEARGIDALIASMDLRSKGVRSYTVQEAAEFARQWAELHGAL